MAYEPSSRLLLGMQFNTKFEYDTSILTEWIIFADAPGGGTLDTLTVNGVFRGKGTTVPDLSVGLDLRNTSILGASPNQGSLQQASIDVGKNIINFNAAHGRKKSMRREKNATMPRRRLIS